MVLYINGNYPYHSLHCELVTKLAEFGNEVAVFVPVNGKELFGQYKSNHLRVHVLYSDCLRSSDRIFFIHKIGKIVREIEKTVNMKDIDCILAGTLYSDGAAAFFLHKKYHIPFAVSIRETDITYQMKWRPYLNGFVNEVLKDADSIVFLSPAYRKYLDRFNCNEDKYTTIPNAVNDYWFLHQHESRKCHDPLSLIYVGEISERKNVRTTISVLAELIRMGIQTVFHIVGSGTEEEACRNLSKKLGVEGCVFFHGWLNDKETILKIYNQADVFVMPSIKETFGTVYIEAMSQGLPIIYTCGQGIDGYFEQGYVGYACNPLNVVEIAEKINTIVNNYDSISTACTIASRMFQWHIVADKYNKIIRDMRNK